MFEVRALFHRIPDWIALSALILLPLTTCSGRKTSDGEEAGMTVEELAAMQGVAVPGSLDDVLGKGVDLWDDGPAFEDFVRGRYPYARPGDIIIYIQKPPAKQ